MKKVIASVIILIVFSNCAREHECLNDPIKIAFIGYAKADIDTLVIKKFIAGSNFQHLQDTFKYIMDTNGVVQNKDTISFAGSPVSNTITYGSDWQVFVPSLSKTINISNIISPQSRGKCSAPAKVACECLNSIQSLIQDGHIVPYPARNLSSVITTWIFLNKFLYASQM